ncbi:hypothetical protein, partial [Leclercia adecarboxylata]|uniref:hypothetical protein n=1 Tax=Leclercia adecarboxylata TaxID=83655 RepID=UPI00234DA6DE
MIPGVNHGCKPSFNQYRRRPRRLGRRYARLGPVAATACDKDNQRIVADRLGKSSGYVSRLINRRYAGSYSEAETIVRMVYGQEDVACPLFGPIPLA